MTTKRAFREEAADDKPLTRAELEAAALRHGVTTSPSTTDRAIAEAVCERLAPGAFTFAGRGGVGRPIRPHDDRRPARRFELLAGAGGRAVFSRKSMGMAVSLAGASCEDDEAG